jgi:hypothetical protein
VIIPWRWRQKFSSKGFETSDRLLAIWGSYGGCYQRYSLLCCDLYPEDGGIEFLREIIRLLTAKRKKLRFFGTDCEFRSLLWCYLYTEDGGRMFLRNPVKLMTDISGLTAVIMKTVVSCDVISVLKMNAPCSLLKVNRYFWRTYLLHICGRRVKENIVLSLIHVDFLVVLPFSPEDGGDMFLRNFMSRIRNFLMIVFRFKQGRRVFWKTGLVSELRAWHAQNLRSSRKAHFDD